MPSLVGILAFVGLLLPGFVLAVLGVLGLRRSGDSLRKVLSVVALVGGVCEVCILAAALVFDWAPWNALLALAVGVLGVAGGVFWVMVLADCLLNETKEGNERIVWTLVIIFTLVIGAGLYYFLRRPKRLGMNT